MFLRGCSIYKLVIIIILMQSACNEKTPIRVEGYDSLRAETNCTMHLPRLCVYRLNEVLIDSNDSYNQLKKIWITFDKNRKESHKTHWMRLDGKYGWDNDDYIKKLCFFISDHSNSTAALTALLEIYLIYSYQETVVLVPHEGVLCDGHANKYYKQIEKIQHIIKYHYPDSWQSFYIRAYLERKQIIAAILKRYKDFRVSDDYLKELRVFDENRPQEFIDFRRHVLHGFHSKKNIQPKLGAHVYRYYVKFLNLSRLPIYEKYYDEYWKYYPEFIPTENHGLEIKY